MAEVRVYLFGYPRVECDGVSIPVPRRKALALLAYLGVTQSHHSRDVLASLLWPEEETAKGYAFLRNALWVLHQTPLDPWILATRHMVGVRPEADLWVDVAEFRRLLATCSRHKHSDVQLCAEGVAALQAAVDMARDGFLAGFVAEDSRSFEEWQFAEADVLTQELAQALERLSDHFERVGDGFAALRYAQRLLVSRALDEPAYRRVMRLQARSGDRAASLRTFDECVRVLDEELSLPPSEETRALADEIRSSSPPPALTRAAPAKRVKRPAYRFPTVGREDDVAELLELLAAEDCRLVTVTGAGGSGKTRLVAEIAERATQFADGTVFVSLVDVDSAPLVPSAILSALGEVALARPAPPNGEGDGSLQLVADHIADRDLLVVLDNAEHLARDPRWLASLVRATREPRFLVTSRQELGVPHETVYPLEGLRFPPSRDAAVATQFPAVQLFLQAARRADARFAPSDEETAAIAAITRHLSGNPLAIELAAAWVRFMPCAAIETEILQSVDFLQTDRKLLPRRHRSLRAAFEGSWALLDREGRTAFRALSVFRGGFTSESAQRVAGVTLPALAALVAKSLLERSGADRYDMLEVVRQYANERLLALPEEAQAARDRHADHFLALLVSQEGRLKGSEQAAAIARVARDEANIVAAWKYAASRGLTTDLARAAMSLFLFCDMTSRFALGRELFGLAASAETGGDPDAGRRRAYFDGYEAWFSSFFDPRAAARLFESCLPRVVALPLDRDLGFIRTLAAFSQHRVNEDLAAQAREALAFFESNGYDWEAGAACEALTTEEASQPAALDLVRRSIKIRRKIGDHWGVALGLYTESSILWAMGELEEASRGFAASAVLRRELGLDSAGQSMCYLRRGQLEASLGRTTEARRDLEEACRIAEQVGYRVVEALASESLAGLDVDARRVASARRHAQRAADAFTAAGLADRAAEMSWLVRRPSEPRKMDKG